MYCSGLKNSIQRNMPSKDEDSSGPKVLKNVNQELVNTGKDDQ